MQDSEENDDHDGLVALQDTQKEKNKKQKTKDKRSTDKQQKKPKKIFYESTEDVSEELSTEFYEKELKNLQIELVKMQYWIKHVGYRVVILFEGRDAAGKGPTKTWYLLRWNCLPE